MKLKDDVNLAAAWHVQIAIAVFGFSHCTYCLGADDAEDSQVDEVSQLLDSMPKWPFSPFVENAEGLEMAKADAKAIEQIAEKIDSYELDVIRAALQRHLRAHDLSQAPYIIIRYLFAVPDDVPQDSPHTRYILNGTGQFFLPKGFKQTNSFPWTVDERGKWRFSVEARGIMGPGGRGFRALEVFDYFRANFGRRKNPSCS